MIKYEFAIKKDKLNSGAIIYTPVCRKKSKVRFLTNRWLRIVQIYSQYFLFELDFLSFTAQHGEEYIPNLTYKDCENHIKGYQEFLRESIKNQISEIEFHTLEEQEY